MADKQRRLARIRAARAQLEAEAKAGPAGTSGSADPDGPGPSSGMQERGARKDGPADAPPDKAQRNFTDPDSRVMPSHGGFIAGYNGQIAVDAAHQIIVAQRLVTNPADFAGLVPLVDQARSNLGRTLREVSGDTGFATEANLDAMAERRVRAYLLVRQLFHASRQWLTVAHELPERLDWVQLRALGRQRHDVMSAGTASWRTGASRPGRPAAHRW